MDSVENGNVELHFVPNNRMGADVSKKYLSKVKVMDSMRLLNVDESPGLFFDLQRCRPTKY